MPIRFSLAQVETTKQNLDALPAADKDTRQVGLKDAVRALAPTLRRLHARGYSKDKIIELLHEQGIAVGKTTLNQYIGPKAAKRTGSRPAAGRVERTGTARRPTSPSPPTATDHPGQAAEPAMQKPAAPPIPAREQPNTKQPAPQRS
jgi:hypothetical protein